jgi:hypothetical protein
MPAFFMQDWNRYKVKIVPNDSIRNFVRTLLLSHDILPYFYGPISFNLKITTPPKKDVSNQIIDYKWALCCSRDEKQIKFGEGKIQFTDIKPYDTEKNKKGDMTRINKTVFSKIGAIDLGHMSILDQYKITMNFSDSAGITSEDMIMAEFTLKDRDEFSLNIVSILLAAFFGAAFGILGSVLVFIFTKGQ